MNKIYKEPTLTEIKKEVLAAGGEYRKLRMKLNGNDVYEVNQRVMTKLEMIERYKLDELWIERMKDVEIMVDGEIAIMFAATTMHEVGQKVAKWKPMLVKDNPGSEIIVLVDGIELEDGPRIDVRLIARNMKTEWIENKLLNCHEI